MGADSIDEKVLEAESIVRRCEGRSGIWADATEKGYKNVYFTRDLAIAIEGILAAGLNDAAQRHLEGLIARQGKDGSIHVWFTDNRAAWFKQKLYRAFVEGEIITMLTKKFRRSLPGYLPSNSPTHDTHDSELHFIDAIDKYANLTGNHQFLEEHKESMHRALEFAESRMDGGLYRGIDWRDNVRFSHDAALLSNNSLLYRVYTALKLEDKAQELKIRIQEQFWNGSYYSDQPGSSFFDAFGQSLAVLHGIATPEQYGKIAAKFESLRTNLGFKANDLIMPDDMGAEERASVERVNQYSKDWPFVTAYSTRALNKMGQDELAAQIFHKLKKTPGFREWYDPFTGKGGGAKLQMWSAALYLTASRELK